MHSAHLVNAIVRNTHPDNTNIAAIRAGVFVQLRGLGWRPSGPPRGADGGPPPSDEDDVLLAAFVRGQSSAFDLLFSRHTPKLNGYARKCLRSVSESAAEDAVQNAWIVLFRRAPQLVRDGHSNIAGYLFVTLYNIIRKTLAAHERASREPDPALELPPSTEEPLAALLHREQAEHLDDLLMNTLSPLEYALVISSLAEKPDAKIAAELEISECNVRVVRHRAYKKLRIRLKEERT
jgi:RNA polymerase sigma factor (sigma-70 family)